MATERLPMRKTREILRQKWELGRSYREIESALGVSHGAVSKAISRANGAKLTWDDMQTLTDVALEARLYPRCRAMVEAEAWAGLCGDAR
jgi:hypothetical protein